MELGNFTTLARHYHNRAKYSETIRDMLLEMIDKNIDYIDAADLGAGTGIWTRQLLASGLRNLIAVEPNDAMRRRGEKLSTNDTILWKTGTGENTGLKANSIDFLSLASSFHWVNTDLGLAEFNRVLRKGGLFCAIWNTRQIKGNKILEDIENMIFELEPNLVRVSSGSSGITTNLEKKLLECPYFQGVYYLHGYHTEYWPVDRYIGTWRSVSDVQTQLGPKKFEDFIRFIENKLCDIDEIKVSFKTRAWVAQKN